MFRLLPLQTKGSKCEIGRGMRAKELNFLPAHFIPLPPFLCLTIITTILTAHRIHRHDCFAYFVPPRLSTRPRLFYPGRN